MPNIIVIGSIDRQLPELLKSTGAHVTSAPLAAMSEIAQPGRDAPDLMLLDIRSTAAIPAALAAVRRQLPSVGIVIVAATMDPALLLDAMRAGVNEFVTEPVTAEAIDRALQHVAVQRPAAEAGKVFGFVGAKGGVGTTTVAVNVATVLGGAAAPGRALLMDLHQSSGDAALYLGAEPRFSVADALDNTHRLDPTFMKGLVTPAAAGLDLLASSDRAAAHADAAKIRAVIDLASTTYRYTVID